MDPRDLPNLKKYKGQTLITTDGTTLLGADDKAGIAEIMTALEYLTEHPEIKHGTVKAAFGPDEEIGCGADNFDVEGFAADFAYTMDGGPVGELEYETFNAALAVITIKGENVHPGTAKGTMVNSMQIGIDFHNSLPAVQVPEKTEGRQGYFHLQRMDGTVEETKMAYIIRDHDRVLFEDKKASLQALTEAMNASLGKERITLELRDQYYNMGEVLAKDMRPVTLAKQAMKSTGIRPLIKAVRGGTDGSKLSFMGLPTPNIFAGGENMHGRYEYVAAESMEKATEVIVNIIKESVGYKELQK
jgi:tripeptide aminopeptidase